MVLAKDRLLLLMNQVMINVKREDRLFIILSSLVWGIALSVTALDFVIIQKLAYPIDGINVMGAILIVVGVAVRRRAKRDLGKYYSYQLRILENHKLVKQGIYRSIRHPAYTGDIVANIGIALLFRSIYGFLVMLLLIPLFLYRIRIEEDMLTARLGKEYIDYKKTTKKLIPGIY